MTDVILQRVLPTAPFKSAELFVRVHTPTHASSVLQVDTLDPPVATEDPNTGVTPDDTAPPKPEPDDETS